MESENESKQPYLKKEERVLSQETMQIQEHIYKIKKPEDKFRYCLDQMKASISGQVSPNFRLFWEIRSLCLPLFKEDMLNFVRKTFWSEYKDLTQEARRLKEILDEKATFTAEQIDLAVVSLEKEIQKNSDLLEQVSVEALPEDCRSTEEQRDFYEEEQKKVNLFSAFASRITSLRKELIQTEMRVSVKNKLFKKLNNLGDLVYPKRKVFIQNISNQFSQDVSQFIQTHFQQEEIKTPYYILREEIKSLQGMGKNLTLNNEVFSETRQKLSECWDVVKQLEKDRKQHFSDKKQEFLENKIKISEQIDLLRKKLEEKKLSNEEISKEFSEISNLMRGVDLGKEEVQDLKREIADLKAPLEEKRLEAKKQRDLEQKEFLEKKQKEMDDIQECITQIQKEKHSDVQILNEKLTKIQARIDVLSLTKYERQFLERSIKPLKDMLADLKEKVILDLSEDDLKSLEQLKNILTERRKRRKEIKNQLEAYRKELDGSGFDFEKAIAYRDMIEVEKSRLENADQGISEIEEKISTLEGR